MCGIVAAVARRDVVPVLVEGLKRLEYRGYDSAGVAVLDGGALQRRRRLGKVAELEQAISNDPVAGHLGIAHTRWATHGEPSEANAHPHFSGDNLAIVHNGIIENHAELKESLQSKGYNFESETDTEVIAHLIHEKSKASDSLFEAVRAAMGELDGAYALVVMSGTDPSHLIAARMGCPVVLGQGREENFVASDVQALLTETRKFQFLEDGDIAVLSPNDIRIFDKTGKPVERNIVESTLSSDAVDKGKYDHYMLKEIHEQPSILRDTLSERIAGNRVLRGIFGPKAQEIFAKVNCVHIVACGTSYHAGLVARYYIEQGAGIPCSVEVASEFRYRNPVVPKGTLFIAISQSGETADTLAALRYAQQSGYLATAAICNVPESSLVREADISLMTRAGPEIGVASTKAFTSQLVALALLGVALARHHGMQERIERAYVKQILQVPSLVESTLELEPRIKEWATQFANKHHALFLGRGPTYPVAMEGALKLKEISYIHAEAYAAGELKHGPLALVDDDMPVIAVAPNNRLVEKLKSNLEEVRARGGRLFIFSDLLSGIEPSEGVDVMTMNEHIEALQAPVVYTVPLQLLSYHIARLRGTDVDQPRNLAKSVTVE